MHQRRATQRAYRQRRKHAIIDAIGNETAASRATLSALLAYQLATLAGSDKSVRVIGPARNTARCVLNEIITRYAIDLLTRVVSAPITLASVNQRRHHHLAATFSSCLSRASHPDRRAIPPVRDGLAG